MSETVKKYLIYSSIMILIIASIIGLVNLVAHLTKTNNHNESRYGVYNIRMVGWDGTTNQQYMRWANESLSELNRLGPTFRIVNSNENISVVRIDTAINQQDCDTGSFLALETNTTTGARRIVMDPICFSGELQFKSIFIHEIGHSLGMAHICRQQDQRNDCSPVGRGTAVMNPTLLRENNNDDYESVNVGALPTWELQELDFAEFCRIRHCQH